MEMMLSGILAQGVLGNTLWLIVLIAFILLLVSTILFLASRYKRCPSDRILVIYGKVGRDQSSHCIHGGGTFVWPLIQDYSYISLTPMTINIPLQGRCRSRTSASMFRARSRSASARTRRS